VSEKLGEISDKMREEALRDFLYEVAYDNVDIELGQKLYEMLEEIE